MDPTDNCEQYPAGGFSDLPQRDELTDLREENRRLQEDYKMLRCNLKNQPGKKKKIIHFNNNYLTYSARGILLCYTTAYEIG